MKKNFLIAFVSCCFFLPLLGVSGFFAYKAFFMSTSKQHPEKVLSELKSHYIKGHFAKAKTLLTEENLGELLDLEDGCELVVSIFAQLKEYKSLKIYSKKCMARLTDSGVGFEGYAMAALALGQGKDARSDLETLTKKQGNPDRLLVALAQLTYELKDEKASRKYFLDLMQSSNLWSAWILRIIKFDRLFQDRKFVRDLSLLLSQKKNIPPKALDHLLAHAKKHELSNCVAALSKALEQRVS